MFMMATQRFNPKADYYTPEDAFDAFETLVYGNVTGESLFRAVERKETYATIIQKGECRLSVFNKLSRKFDRPRC